MPADSTERLAACARAERECPGWLVWWTAEGENGPTYCAAPEDHNDVGVLSDPNIHVLCGLITYVESGIRCR